MSLEKTSALDLAKGQQLPTKLWTVNFILICLSSLAVYIPFHMLLPTLPMYILANGGTKGSTGLALGVLTFAAVLSRPIVGWSLDNYGRKIIFIGGLLVFLLPSAVYISLIPLSLLLIFRFVQGIGWGMCSTASGTIATDIVPKERLAEGMGFFSLTASISLAISPAIGLWLIDAYSFQFLFIACTLLNLLSIALALVIRYPRVEVTVKKTNFAFIEMAALRPALVTLFVAMTYSSLLSFLALFAIEQGLKTASVFFTTLALTTLLSRPFGGRIVDKLGSRGYDFVVIPGIIAIILAMPVIASTTSSIYLIAGGIFFGIGFGFVQPTMLALSINSVPAHKKGAANGTYWTAFDIGVAVGSIVWGIIAGAWGYSMMFNLTIVAAILAMASYLINRK